MTASPRNKQVAMNMCMRRRTIGKRWIEYETNEAVINKVSKQRTMMYAMTEKNKANRTSTKFITIMWKGKQTGKKKLEKDRSTKIFQ